MRNLKNRYQGILFLPKCRHGKPTKPHSIFYQTLQGLMYTCRKVNSMTLILSVIKPLLVIYSLFFDDRFNVEKGALMAGLEVGM